MAPRRGAAPAVVEEEPQGTSLVFDEPLSWRVGKAIPTSELLKRLDTLSKELKDMDQDECDKGSLTKVAKELAAQTLLGHKDKGVRALVACCLVDILSLCAPDAPFTPPQTKDIFTLFITSILPSLADPRNAYNIQHMYVLSSLAEVKSIILLTDLPNHEPLILHLFSSLFDIFSSITPASSKKDGISKNVEFHMNSLLVTLVDEAPNLPPQAIDIIIAQFLRAVVVGSGKARQNGDVDSRQSTLMVKELPAAYRTAKYICDQCPEKMARYISQYFNEVILEASGSNENEAKPQGGRKSVSGVDSEDEVGASGPTEADIKELAKAHRLLRELWRASPAVLQNVIPQLEAELSAENIQLRLLATETLGDIVSGIGAAGPPPPPPMDPAAYPPLRLNDMDGQSISNNVLTTPLSPESFTQTHHAVYNAFVQRKADKSPIIRSGWATAAGRILATSAGGIGLSRDEETTLITGLAEKLNDSDERVRIAAIKAVATFSYRDIVTKIAPTGDVNKSGSLLCNLSDRARDRKQHVRVEGMKLLATIWGVAAADIADGEVSVVAALGGIPTKIYDAFYANDVEITTLLDHVTFEQLVPLNYPTTKAKASKSSNGDNQTLSGEDFDPDKIRTERILTLVKSLGEKSKAAFFKLQERQIKYRAAVASFLTHCERYNGGVMDDNAAQTKAGLTSIITWLVFFAADKPRATADFWKYAKIHDRRSYQLIRFSMAPESDFKTVHKAIKEFSKRMEGNSAAPAGILDLLLPMIYRCASLMYNKSHLPAILAFSRSDENGFSATAHEILKQISEVNPDVFKAQVQELCKLLEEQAPTATRANDLGSVQTLKACSGYARKYPKEIPTDRKFLQALSSFAQFGVPPKSAKYAVSILMTSATRKEMHAKDLLQKVTKDWTYGTNHFLTRLATISQLTRLEPKAAEDASDEILDITTQEILLKVRNPASPEDPKWQTDAELDEECEAKCWALKVLVNRIRATDDAESIKAMATPVYRILNTLIVKEGELSKAAETPRHHRSRLRLLAAQLMLKLCAGPRLFDDMLTPSDFINLALVVQDPQPQVRSGFVEKLKRYLVKGTLPNRFYVIIFLVAFEPDMQLRQSTMTWIKARAKIFRDQDKQVLEAVLPRLLSLLAHHPDYAPDAADLADTAQYLLFYIGSISTEDNLGLIYKYAQRVKQTQDAITPDDSERLYVLSDLAQAVIRKWQGKKGWNMQTYPGKTGLSKDLFAALPSHEVAQEIAEKPFLPDEMDDLLDGLVKKISVKKQKRRSDDDGSAPAAKRPRSSTAKLPVRPGAMKKPARPKTPGKPKKTSSATNTPSRSSAIPDSERRRSGRSRASIGKVYADRDSSEDEEEMLNGVSKWEYEDGRIEGGDEDEEDEDEGSDEDEEQQPEDDSDNEEKQDEEMAEAESEEPAEAEVEEDPAEGTEADVEDEEIADDEEEEAEVEPSRPPKANGRAKRGTGPAPPPAPNTKPKAKAKTPIKAKPVVAPTRTSSRRARV